MSLSEPSTSKNFELFRSYSWTSEISAPLKKSSCNGFADEELGVCEEERGCSDEED